MYAELNEGEEATAQDLLENVWPARGYPLPYLAWPLTWQEDPYHEAYWEFYFYGLRPEATLLYEWETTGQAAYLEKLIAILRSYVAYDAGAPRRHHDLRQRPHLRLPRDGADQLLREAEDRARPAGRSRSGPGAVAREARRVPRRSRHFEADYNHGFNEGAALLLLADNFPHMPGASAWRTLALERLQEMLTNTIDADGVEVENSPFYQVYVLGLVYQIAQWAKRYEPALGGPYSEAATKMLRFTADVTQPNGYLPMLGATATTYMPSQDPTVYGPMAAADPEFDFAFTRGAHGTPPPDGTVLFPVSGLFLMRSPLGSVVKPSQPDVRHLQRRHLPDEPLRPRRARNHDVLERREGAPHLGALHLHRRTRPRVLPRHPLAQHRGRRRQGPGRGLRGWRAATAPPKARPGRAA